MEHGTPPDAAEFMNLWPHADVHTMRTILGVLAVCEGRKRTRRIGSLCECSDAMREARETYETDLHDQFEHQSPLPVGHGSGKGDALKDADQDPPLASVPRPSRKWRHLAAACVGLVVVVGGGVGWQEFFIGGISHESFLGRSGQYAALLEEWESGASERLEDSIVTQNGHEVVSFDLLDENTGGSLSLAGMERSDPVDAEVARSLLRTFHNRVRALVGKTEAEVLAGLDGLFLELEGDPAWAWLKYATHPPRQLLLRASQRSTDRDN